MRPSVAESLAFCCLHVCAERYSLVKIKRSRRLKVSETALNRGRVVQVLKDFMLPEQELHAVFPPVCTKNLNPDVLVMKPTENRVGPDATVPHNRAMDWGILVERPMRPQLIIVSSILRKDSPQMRLAQYDHMIDALTPD